MVFTEDLINYQNSLIDIQIKGVFYISFLGKRRFGRTSGKKYITKEKVCNCCTKTFHFVTSNLTFCTIVASVLVLFACSYYYHFSVFYNFKEVGYKQQQDDLKKDFVEFHNELGKKFLYDMQIDAAKAEFNQVLEVDPLNQNATRCLYECSLFSEILNGSYDPNRYNPGILRIQLDELSEKYPDDPVPYLYSGVLAFSLGYTQHASDDYNKSLELDSSVSGAYYGLGVIYDQKQEYYQALSMFQKAVDLSFWDTSYRNNLASTYYSLKDYKNALFWYNDSVKIQPRSLSQYYDYSKSFRCLGDLESALDVQEKQIALMEVNSTANLTVNQVDYYNTLNNGTIITLFSYDAKKYYSYYNIALTCYLLGNETKTLEYVKKANDLHIDEDSKSNIKMILNFDIENLQEAQPKFRNKTLEFKNKFE